MGFIWNIYEKSFTPYFAALAPKHLVNRHKLVRQPCKLSPFWQDNKTKNTIRLIRRYILQNNRIYMFGILFCK